MENMKTAKEIIEKNNIDKTNPPHWVTVKAAILSAEEYANQQVQIEREKIKRRLKKWISSERNHDEYMYPWEHI